MNWAADPQAAGVQPPGEHVRGFEYADKSLSVACGPRVPLPRETLLCYEAFGRC